MRYPAIFYIKTKTNKIEYFSQGDQLDVNRLIQGPLCWQKISIASTEKKKKLILADWTAACWSHDKKQQVKGVILELIDNEFEVYVYDRNSIFSLAKNDVDILEAVTFLCNSDYLWPEQVIEYVVEHTNIRGDEIQVLDSYWLQNLIEKNFERPHLVNPHEFIGLRNTSAIYSHLDKRLSRYKGINHTHFSFENDLIINILKVELPASITTYQSLSVEVNQIYDLPGQGEIKTSQGYVFKESDLANIIELKLSASTSFAQELFQDNLTVSNNPDNGARDGAILNNLLTLLKKMPKLESLIINSDVKITDIELWEDDQVFPLITNLEIYSPDILRNQNFRHFLSKFTGVRHLIATSIYHADLDLFPELVSLNLSGVSLDCSLQTVLDHHKNLQYLTITPDQLKNINQELDTGNLVGLTITAPSIQRYKLDFIHKILGNAKKLKHLSLTNIKITEETDEILLPQLCTLNLNYCEIVLDTFVKLFKHSIGLVSLSLPQTMLNYEIMSKSFEQFNFCHLKKLDISNTYFSGENMVSLAGMSKKLEWLNLNGAIINGEIQQKTMFNLISIDLTETIIPANILARFLINSSIRHLKTNQCRLGGSISLSYNPGISSATFDDLTLKPQFFASFLNYAKNLSYLKIFNCIMKNYTPQNLQAGLLSRIEISDYTRIDDSILEDILNASVVKHLILSDIVLTESISNNLGDLPLLTDLVIMDHEKHNYQWYNNLFSHVPNLENLTLISFQVTDEIADSVKKMPLKKLILDEGTNINLSNLRKMLVSSLTWLCLNFWSNSEDSDGLSVLNLPFLKTAIFNNTDPDLISDVLFNSPYLEHLEFTESPSPFYSSLSNELSCLQNLKTLKLRATDLDLQALEKISQIETLFLDSLEITNNFSFDGTLTFNLKSVSITSSVKKPFPEEAIIYLVETSPYLQSLDVQVPQPEVRKLQDHPVIKKFSKVGKLKIKAVGGPDKSRNINDKIIYCDPEHNPTEFLGIQPSRKDASFTYKGPRQTLDQTMFIEKLSQYLILSNTYLEYIPYLQNGICKALSKIFLKKPWLEWINFTNAVGNWDGKAETLNNPLLLYSLDELLSEFQNSYIRNPSYELTFLAFNLEYFIRQQIFFGNHQFELINPWHEIVLKFDRSTGWFYTYDSNSPDGAKINNNPWEFIRKSLGNLISVAGSYPGYIPDIDGSIFINEGGLILLCIADNKEAARLLNLVISPQAIYPKHLKQGLLIRGNSGEPAWHIALNHHNPGIVKYTERLIAEFQKHFPNHEKILTDSIAHVHKLKDCTTDPSSLSLDPNPPKNEKMEIKNDCADNDFINNLLERRKKLKSFRRKLKTWKKHQAEIDSPFLYCQYMIEANRKALLIDVSSSPAVTALAIMLEEYCNNSYRPVFYINSADDLVCSASFIRQEGDTGYLVKGPGGSLHDFLVFNSAQNTAPVFIVNYDNFDADEILRLNTLIDKYPLADGTPLPACASVIALINRNKPGCYKGNDFYSRFGVGNVDICPLSSEQLSFSLPVPDKSAEDNTFVINLCHANDWKERLLGRWLVNEDQLHFEQGLLKKALDSGLPIEIQNGLWEDKHFQDFWVRACKLGRIKHYDISKVKFVKTEGYDWDKLKKCVSFSNEPAANAEFLNPSSLAKFFRRYQCNNRNMKLNTNDGLIKENKGKTISLTLTRSLTQDEWGMLLHECEQYQVKIDCYSLPSVQLPEQFGNLPSSAAKLANTAQVIASNDIDVTIEKLKTSTSFKVFDISELSAHDLLTHIEGRVNEKGIRPVLEFIEHKRVLTNALNNGDNIILKGKFSAELADALAPVITQEHTGKLILVTDNVSHLNYVNCHTHNVAHDEKTKILLSEFPQKNEEITTLVQTTSLCHARAKLKAGANHPWHGLEGLSGNINVENFDPENSRELAETFIQARIKGVNSILAYSPFVFITGLTGVGKSTFVDKYIADENTKVFFGEGNILEWATNAFNKNDTEKRKILFIDEANISSSDWSQFETLFDDTPHILINGVDYQPGKNDKVIFAGNPLNYGNRKMASLFERHGNALVFEPMPAAFIYEYILKAVFANTHLEPYSVSIATEILKAYQFLCNCSKTQVLISPRELQMMALLVLSHANLDFEDDVVNAAKHHVCQIAKNLVPKENIVQFNNEFNDLLPVTVTVQPVDFVLTPSREPLCQIINDMLGLHEWRKTNAAIANEAQLYGGVNCLDIEGEPGIGKSELVIAQLKAQGYKEVTVTNKVIPDKAYFRMPISMQPAEKEELLLKAFNEGAIVIIDEINSAPMVERLLNDLLMGKTADNLRPAKPGFMIIGTQNPSTMDGRFEFSEAVKRRMITVELPSYDRDELITILNVYGAGYDDAGDMADIYFERLRKAKSQNLSPEPCVRDLVNTAITWIKENEARIALDEKIIITDDFLFSNKSRKQKKGEDEYANDIHKKKKIGVVK